MDESVLTALCKWPNVPACHGWLELDARGQWRLGADSSAPREIVRHAGLANFLGRNYSCTERGEWFCQNGPQRAYVSLAVAPWVLRLDHEQFTTHTELNVLKPCAVYLDEMGRFFVDTEHGLGIIDDRDLPAFLNHIVSRVEKVENSDAVLEAISSGQTDGFAFLWHQRYLDLRMIDSSTLESQFGFVRVPSAG